MGVNETLLAELAVQEDDLSFRAWLRAMMHELGGPIGLARKMADDFHSEGVGTANRLKLGLALVSALEQHGSDQAEDLSAEDLKAEAKALMEEEPSGNGDGG